MGDLIIEVFGSSAGGCDDSARTAGAACGVTGVAGAQARNGRGGRQVGNNDNDDRDGRDRNRGRNNNGGNNNGGGNTTTVGNKQIIEGTAVGEVLTGAGGIDVIRGKAGRDTIRGLDGNDNLFGNSGVDTIDGGAGGDLIVGNQGNDILTGGLGADKFLFNATTDMSDIITDFNVDEDVIRLRGARFGGGLSAGNLAPNQFHLGATATQGTHRVIYNSATGELFFDEDGNGAASAHLIATLEGLPDLTASDISIV